MGEFRWTEVLVMTLLLLLPVAEGAASKYFSSVTVRDGVDATLSCETVRDDQDGCDNTTWIFRDYWSRKTTTLTEHGKIHKEAGLMSDRLRVTENCSLVIERVSDNDAGLYACRQFNTSGRPQASVSLVLLTVVSMNEWKNDENVTLTCSVITYGLCPLSVRWSYQGEDVDKDRSDLWTSQSDCEATVSFSKSNPIYGSSSNLSCEIGDDLAEQPQIFFLETSPEQSEAEDLEDYSSVTVRDGADATLSCETVRDDQDGCDNTTWIAQKYPRKKTTTLTEHGKIHKEAGLMSDRLRVTENCSLVIEKVSVFDSGLYACRQFKTSGRPQASVSLVLLTVVSMYEQKNDENVTLTCYYSTYGLWPLSVRWLYEGEDVDKDRSDLWTSQSDIEATVSFSKSNPIYGSSSKLSCEIGDDLAEQPQIFFLETSPEQSEAEDLEDYSSVTVRDGVDVTLSCETVRDDQDGCDNTTWIFTDFASEATVTLSEHGKIHKDAGDKSDRLRVTEACSLVIEKVSVFDAGLYACGQSNTEEVHGEYLLVLLSVITMDEQVDGDNVMLTCSVWPDGQCPFSVRWLYQGEDVGEDRSDLWTSQSDCEATVSFQKSHHIYGSRSNFLSCEVLHDVTGQPLTFFLQTSPEKSGEEETMATENSVEAGHWRLIAVSVGATVLIITIIIIMTINIFLHRGSRVRDSEDDGGATFENTGSSDSPASIRLH